MRNLSIHALHAIFFLTLLGSIGVSGPVYAGSNDIRFIANLSDDEQSTPTYSDGKGIAEIILERETLKITWNITYQNLSSKPIEAGIYGPENVGATAGLQINFGVNGLASPIKGSAVLNEGQLQYLITERMYVNILTTKWKGGELRGQLQRQPPK